MSVNNLCNGELIATKGAGFRVTDALSLDRKNTGHHLDGLPVSRVYSLAPTRSAQTFSASAS